MILSKKALAIEPSITLEITAAAKKMKSEGIDIVSFGAGEPDFDTPEYIKEAAKKAMQEGKTKYTPSSGILELKECIAKKLKKDNDLEYAVNQIIVSTGAKQCLSNVFQAILNPGDEVLVAVPFWVSYPELIKLSDGVPVFVDCGCESNYKYSLNALEQSISTKTKAIVINSPNNPSGAVYSENELIVIANFAKQHDLFIISDEIYEKLIYGNEKHISIASLSKDAYERTIVINGVSKSYSMTGWRIGYAAGNAEIIKVMTNIQSHTTSNPNSIAQFAALAAISQEDNSLSVMVEEFRKRRNYMSQRLNDIKNISYIKPDGAFYVMVNISNTFGKQYKNSNIYDSLSFSKLLLENYNTAVIPGAAFGMDNYIRLSYATSMQIIEEGLDRLEKFITSVN
jgi:aspartate aminotransferase